MKNFAIQNRVLQRDRVLQRRVLERYYCTTVSHAVSLIHDVNPSQLSGASHRSSEESLREAFIFDAQRDTVTHRATTSKLFWVSHTHI